MRRLVTIGACVLAIALPPADAVAALRSSAEARAAPKKTVVTRKVVGSEGYADRWGTVVVTLTVRKTTVTTTTGKKVTRRIAAVDAQYAVHSGRSELIMSQALPLLRAEALASQGTNVQYVSGATDTSDAFAQSLQSALLLARKV